MEINWLCWITFITLLILIDECNTRSDNHQSNTKDNLITNSYQEESVNRETEPDAGSNASKTKGPKEPPHSRQKRLIWITDDGRLALPPGTSLTFTPTIALPLVRYPPEGFLSNITISLPVTMDFDKLGLTDNSNPLGVLPPVFARSFGHSAGIALGNYIASYLHYRKKREAFQENVASFKDSSFKMDFTTDEENPEPQLPMEHRHVFHGGERALLYGVVEDFLATFGMNGKGCLLRAICEFHSKSIERYGLLGEMAKLFLTATQSPFAEHIYEYVEAQKIGEGKMGPGECFPYYKDCPKSLFKYGQNLKYRENLHDEHHTEELNDTETDELFDENLNDMQSEILSLKARSPLNRVSETINNIISM